MGADLTFICQWMVFSDIELDVHHHPPYTPMRKYNLHFEV